MQGNIHLSALQGHNEKSVDHLSLKAVHHCANIQVITGYKCHGQTKPPMGLDDSKHIFKNIYFQKTTLIHDFVQLYL